MLNAKIMVDIVHTAVSCVAIVGLAAYMLLAASRFNVVCAFKLPIDNAKDAVRTLSNMPCKQGIEEF